MLIYEYKADGTREQDAAIDEAIRTTQFIRNKCLCKWMDERGIPIIAVDPHFTSQDCSACGTRVKKSLSVRTHICPGCGVVLDRDHNAALRILQKAVAMYPGAQGNIRFDGNAWGEPTSTVMSAMATQQAGSPNQEPPRL